MESQDRIVYSYQMIKEYIDMESNLDNLSVFYYYAGEGKSVFLNSLTEKESLEIKNYLNEKINQLKQSTLETRSRRRI